MTALFCALVLVEFVLFGMQRGLLLLAREHQVEYKHVTPLLPGWFGVSWLVTAGKWLLLGAIAWTQNLWLAAGLAVGGFVLSTVLPIPYRMYLPLLRKQAGAVMRVSPAFGMELRRLLDESQVFGR